MKNLLIVALVFAAVPIGAKTNSPCAEVTKLEKTLVQSKAPQEVLFKMAKLAQQITNKEPLDLNEFRQNPEYKNICHYKVVKSENFGDFPSYSGYHYFQILKKYPKSNLADDAAYELIYVITQNAYNFSDKNEEKKKLEAFIKKYPKSNNQRDRNFHQKW